MPTEKELAAGGYYGFHPRSGPVGPGVDLGASSRYTGYGIDPKAGAVPTENKAAEGDYPIHVGGGWYELSNGERVQGKDAARKAEADLGG